MNPVRPMAEKQVSEQTADQQPDIRVTLLLHAIPAKTETLLPTRVGYIGYITSSAQATLYDAQPSSHWGINE